MIHRIPCAMRVQLLYCCVQRRCTHSHSTSSAHRQTGRLVCHSITENNDPRGDKSRFSFMKNASGVHGKTIPAHSSPSLRHTYSALPRTYPFRPQKHRKPCQAGTRTLTHNWWPRGPSARPVFSGRLTSSATPMPETSRYYYLITAEHRAARQKQSYALLVFVLRCLNLRQKRMDARRDFVPEEVMRRPKITG